MTGGSGQYTSLYPGTPHTESSKWDAIIKANENLLKEKELTIERLYDSFLCPTKIVNIKLMLNLVTCALQAEAANVSAGTASQRE